MRKRSNGAALKKILAILLIFCFLCLSGCSSGNIGDETTEPLDKMIQGVLNKNISVYKSAFPPDYIEAVEYAYKRLSNDIDKELETTLSSANDVLEANYGKKVKINYKLVSKVKMTEKDLKEKYWDLLINSYSIPVEKITEAYKESIEITVKGRDTEESKTSEFKFLKIDGTWYIHPESFMFVFY